VEEDWSGREIGHYRLREKIGEGGMGVVWKAEDTRLGRQVAIKFLPPTLVRDPERRERFRREARSAAALSHPNIAVIHEIGEHEGSLFFVMELIQGTSLGDRIRKGPLPLRELADLAVPVAEALDHAHRQGIVHRDLKPDNVMVTPERKVKLLDFGLAKPLLGAPGGGEGRSVAETVSADLTLEGTLAGTFSYMSPELAQGRPVDARSDLFAFGILLYEMAAGVRPFRGGTWASTLAKILEENPPPLREHRPGVPAELERIVERCLRKQPEERYATAAELLVDLGEFAQSLSAGRVVERRRAIPRGFRAGAFWTLGAVLAGILIWAGYARFAARAGRAPAPAVPSTPGAATSHSVAIAVLPFAVHGAGQFDYLGKGIVNLLGAALDGAGPVRSVDARAILGAVQRERIGITDPDTAGALARRLGASLFVLGDIVEAGGRLRVQAAVYETGDDPRLIARAEAEGMPGDVFGMVDTLAARILAAQPGGPSARVARVAAVTTGSIEALKAYLEGEAEFRAGRFTSAAEAFQRAVEADPSFALAYYRLSIATEWGLTGGRSRGAAEKAVQHSHRLSRHDRLILEAMLTWRRGHAVEAERLYRTVVGSYPDDVEAWFELGEVLFHAGPFRGRSFTESREAFERVLVFEPDHVPSLLHLIRIAAFETKHEEMVERANRVLRLNPEGERALEARGMMAYALGDVAAQRRLLEEARRVPDAPLTVSANSVVLHCGDIRGSADLVRESTNLGRAPETRLVGHTRLAHLEAMQGRFSTLRAEMEKVERLNAAWGLEYRAWFALLPFREVPVPEIETLQAEIRRWNPETVPPSMSENTWVVVHEGLHPLIRLYLMGIAEIRLRRVDQALAHASALETRPVPEAAASFGKSLGRSLRAQAALARGKTDEALRLLDQPSRGVHYLQATASPFFSLPNDRYLLAGLLTGAGRAEEAIGLYGSFAETSFHELPFVVPALLRRAEILESLGRGAEAAADLRRALDLWRDCDADLAPLAEEARGRLARLEGKSAAGR
jgi:tetratricopeptide (TPR) repeat protein/tRNA A-37 threonylcarbamoyl transferase component Bud32